MGKTVVLGVEVPKVALVAGGAVALAGVGFLAFKMFVHKKGA